MKISKADFESMRAKYDKEVKKGKPGKNKKGEITDQTDWIFFDRETLEGLLAKANPDPKKGGIKFYFSQYSESVAKKYHPNNPGSYDGMVTLVMTAANEEAGSITDINQKTNVDDEGEFENIGRMCPPYCDPKP
jgi:hypothetical protein